MYGSFVNRVITIGISSLKEVQHRTAAACRGKKQGARISFATEELLWKTLTPKRWALLKTMAGKGALAICESLAGSIATCVPCIAMFMRC